MDERQTKVEVGAGLQESQLNQDLIDFLKKWGDWILYVVLAVVVLYAGSVWWGRYQDKKLDEAFAQWTGAQGVKGVDGVHTGSPDNLLRVAEESKGRGSVRELATLGAADIYLACARRGIGPGGDVTAPSEDDILSDDEAEQMMRRAEELYQRVATETEGDDRRALLHMRALWGLAATASSLGDTDRAATSLKAIEQIATDNDYPDQLSRAQRALEELDEPWKPLVLYASADLPEANRPEEAPAIGAPTPQGPIAPIQISPVEQPADDATDSAPDDAQPDAPAPEDDSPADEPAPAEPGTGGG